MQIVKRGNKIYFPGASGESEIKYVLKNVKFD